MARLAVAALTAMKTVEAAAMVGTAVADTMIAIVARAMTIVTGARMAAAMITDPAVLTGMPQADVMTGIAAAVGMIAVEAVNTMAAIADVLAMEATVIRHLQEMLAIRMEVELSMTAQTIGTLVVELRFTDLLRCGALCQIKAPTPASTTRH